MLAEQHGVDEQTIFGLTGLFSLVTSVCEIFEQVVLVLEMYCSMKTVRNDAATKC